MDNDIEPVYEWVDKEKTEYRIATNYKENSTEFSTEPLLSFPIDLKYYDDIYHVDVNQNQVDYNFWRPIVFQLVCLLLQICMLFGVIYLTYK